ncbi:hypothetical protein FN976_24210 [Caenimonas sedimenti]|uniref:Copper resistance protein n=1 Tax=Caenimonas sedimenti TaxID=2596921 RepID=A0A562ZHH8_9BURK|nr:hypothetical protein [Caenimonas sedimenti]TWO68049.1 hypothetical protein FN976_24210 [Caenimonas sedimenti]
MTLTRRSRLFTVMLSLWALLFAQTALAGYVCPGAAKAVQVAEMMQAGMPCAESMSRAMDDEQPGLCHAHCQAAQQSADNYQLPTLANLAELGAVLTVTVASVNGDEPLLQASLLRRATAPPLAVRNCCFRI